MRLVSVDGYDLGRVIHQQPTRDSIILYLQRTEWAEKYRVLNKKAGVRILKQLFARRSLDPKHLDVVVGLLRRLPPTRFSLDPRFVLPPADDAPYTVVLYDGKGNPVPLEALLTSGEERDRIASLQRLYQAYVEYERPRLLRELDFWRRSAVYARSLLRDQDFYIDTLFASNYELLASIRQAYAYAIDVLGVLETVEDLLQAEAKRSAALSHSLRKALELVPQATDLLVRFVEEVSRVLTTTMQKHASEIEHAEIVSSLAEDFLRRAKELEAKFLELSKGGGVVEKPGKESGGKGKPRGGGSEGGEKGGGEEVSE